MARAVCAIALIFGAFAGMPHPIGQYYVEEAEPDWAPDAAKKASTKWPTAEERRKLRAAKLKEGAGVVAFRMGRPVDIATGTNVKLSDDGFGLTVEKAGDNVNFPKKGDVLTMHYTGKLKDGTTFDSSYDRGQPFQFTIGRHQVITGWDQGIVTMSLGEKAMLHVPSYKGYGDKRIGVIPANSDLEFDVELLAINDLKAPDFDPSPMPTRPTAEVKSGTERVSMLWVGATIAFAARMLL